MLPKNKLLSSVPFFFATLGFFCAAASCFSVADEASQSRAVKVLECENNSDCVMFFGKVGETFECKLATNATTLSSTCSVGVGENGANSVLPKGSFRRLGIGSPARCA